MPKIKLYIIAETLAPIRSDRRLTFLPDTTFAQAPPLDILFVPEGPGINAKLEDKVFLDFLANQGKQAKYVTSICTGSLLLAAVGLLDGYYAPTHWLCLELLEMLGVETIPQRVNN